MVGIGKSQVQKILAEADLKPHQVRSWLQSIDPEFETKQAEVCGLYLNPPEGAIVVSIGSGRIQLCMATFIRARASPGS